MLGMPSIRVGLETLPRLEPETLERLGAGEATFKVQKENLGQFESGTLMSVRS
jgi:hypothetical protein